ncbi:hypothetical protein BJY01DRAFT_103956 [Aspergillus pseudoustus]|uniref:Secreted protein n=1 Tax=Aspergillus pseudoustus TaxID=1810923 RepID=A0ABR4KL22_9EURO
MIKQDSLCSQPAQFLLLAWLLVLVVEASDPLKHLGRVTTSSKVRRSFFPFSFRFLRTPLSLLSKCTPPERSWVATCETLTTLRDGFSRLWAASWRQPNTSLRLLLRPVRMDIDMVMFLEYSRVGPCMACIPVYPRCGGDLDQSFDTLGPITAPIKKARQVNLQDERLEIASPMMITSQILHIPRSSSRAFRCEHSPPFKP